MIHGTVLTSSNVASVQVRIGTLAIDVPKTGVGAFALDYRVPWVPFFFYGRYNLQVIASNSRGDRTVREIPITVRY